jgi:formamidopyrimidine-DNA glycosylase
MPELPEVETTRRGLLPHLLGRRIRQVVVRNGNLRWPVPAHLDRTLRGEEVLAIRRRGKYLLFDCPKGHLLVHLGMSGRLTIVPEGEPPRTHDHVDVRMDDHKAMRFTDPRRFGAMLWVRGPAEKHVLLEGLGLEPLEKEFDGRALYEKSRGRKVAIKQFLMDQHVVVGVGNIYASEALFRAGIDPRRVAGRVTRVRFERLVTAVRAVLGEAIRQGGTTLRDYVNAEGTPGYFRQELYVYERAGEPCRNCRTTVRQVVQGQRSTYFCPRCQA